MERFEILQQRLLQGAELPLSLRRRPAFPGRGNETHFPGAAPDQAMTKSPAFSAALLSRVANCTAAPAPEPSTS